MFFSLCPVLSLWVLGFFTVSLALSTNRVEVRREYHLPILASPVDARKAWFEFVWENGGGLPLLMILPRSRREATRDLETLVERRMLLPLGMEEQLLSQTRDPDEASKDSTPESTQVQYKVTKSGILASEIVPDSHLGTVTFEAHEQGGTRLVWDVSFETKAPNRTFIWQAVTEQTIGDTCRNFQASTDHAISYERVTYLPYADHDKTAEEAVNDWVTFCWNEGAGFPNPIPPIRIDNIRWIVPPFLKEKLSEINLERETDGTVTSGQIFYNVENPGLFTYQVFSHSGSIMFTKNREVDLIKMHWIVEIRPYPGWERFVKAFTGAVISSYARNFKAHVMGEGDRIVELPLPPALEAFNVLRIRQDSWVGGVADAFLNDRRKATARVVDAFRPWTWGRGPDFDEGNEYESWSDEK